MLGEQMLGRGYRDEHILVLRPPYSEAGWRLDLSVSSQRETLHYLTTWCMQHGLDITVYCDALDAGMRDALKDRLLNASPKGRVTIIPDVDELPGGVLDADVVLYASNSNDHAAQELKSRARSKIPVIITVATGADKSQSAGILGIVLDRASPSFVAAHLRNVYRLLPDEAPIELDAWRRFGIRLEQLSGEALAGEVAVDIDRYEGSNEAIARSLWGMTCASPRQLSPYPVDVFFPAERELAVFATCDRSGFFMKSLPNTASRTGRAEWQLQNGQQLRQVDLVHETELLLRYDGNSYVPIHVDGEKRPVILTAGHFNGDESDDAFLPVVDLAFEVPTKVKQIAQAGGSANIGIYWCQLEVDPSPIMVDSGIVGRCSRAGIETPMTRVDFTYPAQLTAIIIRPCDWSAKQLDDLFSQTLQGKWSTNQENFDPVLTAAVASTFARTLVGVPRFARVIAARFNESDRKRIGEAVVWLIEALDTGRSASMAILEVLRDVKHREVILARIDRFTEIAEKDKSVQRLRAMSGLPTAGDARQHPTNISVANKQVS
jgi:hypothetical protein